MKFSAALLLPVALAACGGPLVGAPQVSIPSGAITINVPTFPPFTLPTFPPIVASVPTATPQPVATVAATSAPAPTPTATQFSGLTVGILSKVSTGTFDFSAVGMVLSSGLWQFSFTYPTLNAGTYTIFSQLDAQTPVSRGGVVVSAQQAAIGASAVGSGAFAMGPSGKIFGVYVVFISPSGTQFFSSIYETPFPYPGL